MRQASHLFIRAVLLAIAPLASLSTTGCGPTPQVIVVPAGSHSDIVPFTIATTPVTNLYPGAVKRLTLTLQNPYDADLRVTDLRGALTATSDSRCKVSTANLVVRAYEGGLPLTIPARKQRLAGTIPLYMPNTVADACQKVTFTIKLTGAAMKVSR